MKYDDEGEGLRHARLSGLLLEELRALLRDDVSDPALDGVAFGALVLSVDYSHARVHFAAEDRARAERGLLRATPYLRAQLALAIDLKRVPELRFVFDGVAARSKVE
jgi:ribosome-binding factor A